MANRFPLIVDSSALQIKELPASDNLDLANSGIVNASSLSATSLTVVDSTVTGGINASGVITASNFSGNGSGLTGVASTDNIITGTAATFTGGITANEISVTGNVSVGGTLTYEDVTNIDSVGIVTAQSGIRVGAGQSISPISGTITYYGDGSQLSGISAGISTEALVANNSVVTLDLTKQDHKITATGICTITVTGGTEADSHTVRLINSGIATVGFSTYFLFPSGSTPTLPEADGSISLLSFTVNRVGAGGTQLLTGASLNYS